MPTTENKTDYRQELFNYMSREHNVILLQSDMDNIENIINPIQYPYTESDQPRPTLRTKLEKDLKQAEEEKQELVEAVRNNNQLINSTMLLVNTNEWPLSVIELKTQVQENNQLLAKHETKTNENQCFSKLGEYCTYPKCNCIKQAC